MRELSLNEMLDQFCVYLEANRNRAVRTVDKYRKNLLSFIEWLENKRNIHRLSDCAPPDLNAFIVTMRHEDGSLQSPRSRNLMMSSIRQFVKWSANQGYIDKDITYSLESAKTGKRTPKALSVEEAERIQAVAMQRHYKERDALIADLFLLLGIRLEELIGLNLTDINDSAGFIHVRGKGDKERDLPLSPRLVRSLDRYMVWRHEVLSKRKRTDETALIISERGLRMSRRMAGVIVEEMGKQAGIMRGWNLSPHKLRHTMATILYNESGADILSIAKILGHEDPNTTKIYTEVKRETIRNVIISNPLEK